MKTNITHLQQYILCEQECTKKYGQLTCVLYKVGNFFELYEIPKRSGMLPNVSKLSIISGLTNLIIVTKNRKHEPSILNHFTMGFSTMSLLKYAKILTDNGFTCVVVDYVGINPLKRQVTNIYYPVDHRIK